MKKQWSEPKIQTHVPLIWFCAAESRCQIVVNALKTAIDALHNQEEFHEEDCGMPGGNECSCPLPQRLQEALNVGEQRGID